MRFLVSKLLKNPSQWKEIKGVEFDETLNDMAYNEDIAIILSSSGLYYTTDCEYYGFSHLIPGSSIAFKDNSNVFSVTGANYVAILDYTVLREKPIQLDFNVNLNTYDCPFNCVAYGDNHFVAVGDQGNVVTYDCVNESWTSKKITSKNYSQYKLKSVVYNDGKFFAASEDGHIFVSNNNGSTWSIEYSDIFDGYTYKLINLQLGNNEYIITATDASNRYSCIIVSDFGVYVDMNRYGLSDHTPFTHVLYYMSQYFICCDNVYTSSDFDNFKCLNAPIGNYNFINTFKGRLITGMSNESGNYLITKRIG